MRQLLQRERERERERESAADGKNGNTVLLFFFSPG